MKVLVIRFSSIGDIVLTTPIVRCLKQQRPDVSIHYLTKAAFKPVVAHNPYIDKVHYLNDDLIKTLNELRAEKFDFIVDLHHNLRTARVKRSLDAKTASFPKLNIRKWLLVNLKVNLMPATSIVERYFETVKGLAVKNDGQGLDYFVGEEHKLTTKDVPMSHWAGYVGCVIGGSYNTKKLPVEKWQDFCNKVPYPVILLGGPEDRSDGDSIAEQDKVKIYNACGKFNINESAGLVNLARVIVSNDTGLMHIAAAYKKPIVSLWGNTSPEMGMFPYYGYNDLTKTVEQKTYIMENKGLSCHPCSKLGYNSCPKKHFKCMNELDMNELAEIVKKFWI
ncbi:MAG: glycosyltransferase family 9 protein [Sphingobacteriales bacterium]|nr:MAG: glycosyltransferase family 9 protein [Sphingobacteriales bacterium]